MISITLEGLGPARSVLAAVGDPGNARLASLAMAESYTDDILNWVAEGKSFTPRLGGAGLEGAISWRPEGDAAWVYANKHYARFIEEGTGVHAGHTPWIIRPKPGRKGLKIPVQGGEGYVLRRMVTHPGSKAFPYFFTDTARREANLLAAARSVIAAKAAGALDG